MNDRHITFGFVILLTGIVFGLDFLGPSDLVSARFYVVPMLLAGLVLSFNRTILISVAAFALTLVSVLFQGEISLDYILLTGLIAIIGILSVLLSNTIGRLRQRTEEAERIQEALRTLNEASKVASAENERLFAESQTANVRLRTLFKLGNNIASRQDIDEIIDEVTSAVEELLSPAHASLMLSDELSGELKMRGHQDLKRTHAIREHTDVCQKLAHHAYNSGKIASGLGEPVHAYNVVCSEHCRFARMATEGKYHSVVSVPVVQNNKVLGVLSSFRIHTEKKESPYSDEDRSLLEAIASLAAIAISNAETLDRQKSIAIALQANLLPATTPTIPGLSIGTFYASATTGASIGGDFYDFIAMPRGRFAICIGDVCGKGIDAASDTAMTKYMLRMIAAEDESPARTLERLNIAIYNNLRPGRFVTLFYGIYDPFDCTFIYSSAGHHSPIHIRDGSPIDFELEQGVALGIVPFTTYDEHRQTFLGNDVVALFTDGLIEARQDGDLLGSDRVAAALGGHIGKSASGMAAALPHFAMEFSGGNLADDLAVVILQRTLIEADIITSAVT